MKKHTRAIACLLSILIILPFFALQGFAKSVTVQANGFNTTRYSGQLIIFTPAMGASTNQNQWGYEVIIEDNVCVSHNSSSGNSTIPSNGFVLSGHGTMADWLSSNISVGDYVFYNSNGAITVTDTDSASALFYSVTTSMLGLNVERQADSIVVYNGMGTSTGTNDWGYEVVCRGGIVTSLGGNNNTVPNDWNSFVVSAHGSGATWLQENVRLGMSISYNVTTNILTVAYDETAVFSGMELRVETLKTKLNDAKARYDLFDYASVESAIASLESDIADAKTEYDTTDSAIKLSKSINAIEAAASEIESAISESRPVEYRAVWVRPTQTSASAVDDYVELLYNNGINTICVETLFDNCMIMPMPSDSLFECNPKFASFDILQAYIDACHSRGMELHAWLPVYHVGSASSTYETKSVGYKRPEWLSVSNTGQTTAVTENYHMIDPANKEAQDFLLESYEYILTTYDIDSLQLDYIRYFTRTSSVDMGYNDHILDAFEARYGVRPTYDTSAYYWDNWVNFRANYITEFVYRIRRMIDTVKPNVLLGADVVPDPTESITYNYQNFFYWLEEGWLDIVLPMAYGSAYLTSVGAEVEQAGGDAFTVVGLGTYKEEFDAESMREQTEYCQSEKADGVAFFESSVYLSKGVGTLLQTGVFRDTAVTPMADIKSAAKTALAHAVSRINNVMLPLGGVTEYDAIQLTNAINAFSDTLGDDDYDDAELAELNEAITTCALSSTVKTRIEADIAYALKGYDISTKPSFTGELVLPEPEPEPTVMLGDVDSDSEITTLDYTFLKRYLIGTVVLDANGKIAGDIDGNGELETIDYTLLKRAILGTYVIEQR